MNNILAKDRHFIHRLKQELRGDITDEMKAKKQAQLDAVCERSMQAVQARIDSIPKHLADTLNPELPVTTQADIIIKAIKEHQVIIVAGETGSGKTTQLPKLALLAGRGITGQIAHTQPRRLAARSVAMRISDELGEPLGQTVSFKVRFSEEGSSRSLVKLMTDGILLAELAHDKFLTRYDTIIIDEAHERSLNIDFILGYLKRLLPKRPDLKVIITSATLDTMRFAEYFMRHGKDGAVPIINVQGRSYPVEVRYRPLSDEIITSHDDDAFDEAEDKLPRAITAAVAECFADAKAKGQPHKSDILIFASTEAEIREISEILHAHAPPHTEILPLFARQSFGEQQRIFAPSGQGRRIIIATNVAETALTVPNIYYVIDLGFARISRYNYRSRIQRLPIEAVSQASANQRMGRCGRIGEGVCIRLYSQEDFNARAEFTEPEILRTNLASVILQMQYLGLGDVTDFDFITPPDYRLINDGKKLLHELGALTDKPTKTATKKRQSTPSQLTAIGKKMARMPIDPRLARMLIGGSDYACLPQVLKIVSALAVQDVRERPSDKQTQADQKHALFRQDDSDFLFYVELFNVLFEKHEIHGGERLTGNARKNFAKKHYLSFPRIKEWQKTHEQLSQMMSELGYPIYHMDNTPNHNATQKDIQSNALPINNKQNQHAFKNLATQYKKTNLANGKSNKTPKGKLDKENTNIDAMTYVNIHRALLTALLSFIAHKSDKIQGASKGQIGEYLMVRNQKARLFPASVLYKKGIEWLMSFEVVETSQVYMRCNAKIEPQWILDQADGLLKYHYFEPHWSKKTGRVRAYAQISLFGLIIKHKELVNYDEINLSESREIFIRDALVVDNYPKPLPFLTHNHQKIKDAQRTEDKLRRRDLLVDEEVLYQFYDAKIPDTIASAKALEDWLGAQSSDEFLRFDDADIYQDSYQNAGAEDFPEVWQLGAIKLPLSYVFDPSRDDDGVSVRVPIKALNQLNSVDLLWGVAGWRYELVVALLKTLPKELRRQIVPIPDTALRIFDKLDTAHNFGLLDQLVQALAGLGVRVVVSDFKADQIDDYLKPLVCVLDDKGRVLDTGRDLDKLKAKHKSASTVVLQVTDGIHDSFPEHYDFVKTERRSGVAIQSFSALVADATGKVAIHDFSDLAQALSTHKTGVLSLIKLTLGAKQKQLTGQIDKAFKLAFAPLGDLDKLKVLVIDATLQATLAEYGTRHHSATRDKLGGLIDDDTAILLQMLPLTADEFAITKDDIGRHFLAVGQNILSTLKDIYTTWQTVRGQLLMLDRDIFGESIDDIEDQLDDLKLGDFICRDDYKTWRQYPRYLQALKIRLDRLPNNLDNDLDGVYALDEHMERLSHVLSDKRYREYRWLIEEYRINLFAQPMKTNTPVSAKRLDAVWSKLATR